MKSFPSHLSRLLTGAVILGALSGGCRRDELVWGYRSIEVGGKRIRVALAITPAQQIRGLKFRTSLPENEGMLFVYSGTVQYPFWMKDTFIPLSVAFVSPAGLILDIQEMEPRDEVKRYHSPAPYQYALEMNQGWFRQNGIRVGDRMIMR